MLIAWVVEYRQVLLATPAESAIMALTATDLQQQLKATLQAKGVIDHLKVP